MFFVDDDESGPGERRERRGARSDHDARLARARPAPRFKALAVRQRRMQDGEWRREAGAKAREQLRRQADLRYQHERLLAALYDRLDGAQIDLGLAAARDTENDVHGEVAERRGDGIEGRLLVAIELRTGRDLQGRRHCRSDGLLDEFDPAALRQFADWLAPPGKLLGGNRPSGGEALENFALALRALQGHRDVDFCAFDREAPAFRNIGQRRAAPQGYRQSSRQDFSDRVVVIAGGPEEEFKSRGIEERLGVEHGVGGANLVPGNRRFGGDGGHDADGAPASEGDLHAHARLYSISTWLRRWPVVEDMSQRRVDRDLEDRRFRHRGP